MDRTIDSNNDFMHFFKFCVFFFFKNIPIALKKSPDMYVGVNRIENNS